MQSSSGLKGVVASLAVVVAACSPVNTYHGYVPLEEDVELLEVGVSGRETVLEAIGPPISRNDLYGDSWFYVAFERTELGLQEPEITDRQVLVVSFDDGGLLRNIERYTLEDGQPVAISRRVTETNLGTLTVVDQILRGVGRVDPTQILDQ